MSMPNNKIHRPRTGVLQGQRKRTLPHGRSYVMWYNPLIIAILRSPLHGLVSKHMLLLTYTGHKSGTEHILPVNYLRNGDCITVISFRHRIWWRSLRDGANVTLRLRGKTVPAIAQAVADEDGVLPNQWITLLSTYPRYAAYLHITFGADGTPDPVAVGKAAKTHVLVHLFLGEP